MSESTTPISLPSTAIDPNIKDTIRRSAIDFGKRFGKSDDTSPRLIGLFYEVLKKLCDNLEIAARAISDRKSDGSSLYPLNKFPKCCHQFCSRAFVRRLADSCRSITRDVEDMHSIRNVQLDSIAKLVIVHFVKCKCEDILEFRRTKGLPLFPAPVDIFPPHKMDENIEFLLEMLGYDPKPVDNLFTLYDETHFFKVGESDHLHPKNWFSEVSASSIPKKSSPPAVMDIKESDQVVVPPEPHPSHIPPPAPQYSPYHAVPGGYYPASGYPHGQTFPYYTSYGPSSSVPPHSIPPPHQTYHLPRMPQGPVQPVPPKYSFDPNAKPYSGE
eukprot:gnl/Carplike_NY0171/4140_a5595_320.p1 GENE.gnl/Carplike_NY0171/4140_a5595_320~~gnl/Carplike_NY0171/4140_a5595_320.p1  ORF type:complete len:328 (+),score=63.68 gnl/Carplike_NY0171/4140_a5595_320:55-1038(+)